MKRVFALALALTLSVPALGNESDSSADLLICNFSQETDITLKLNLKTEVASIELFLDGDTPFKKVLPEVDFNGPDLDDFAFDAQYSGVTNTGYEFLKLRMTYNGHDGANDNLVYPFDAELILPEGGIKAGGCYIPSLLIYDLMVIEQD